MSLNVIIKRTAESCVLHIVMKHMSSETYDLISILIKFWIIIIIILVHQTEPTPHSITFLDFKSATMNFCLVKFK